MRSRFSPYQKECDNYTTRPPNHDTYLQRVKKNLHRLLLMIKTVSKLIFKVNLGSDSII